MNDHDLLLKAQSHLDGELSASDLPEVEARLQSDSRLRALRDELQAVKTALTSNEPNYVAPVSREFYWSRIEREINLENPELRRETSRPSAFPWLKVLAPFGVAALIVLGSFALFTPESSEPVKSAYYQEIETPLEDATVISFVSHGEGMTIVWVGSGQ